MLFVMHPHPQPPLMNALENTSFSNAGGKKTFKMYQNPPDSLLKEQISHLIVQEWTS